MTEYSNEIEGQSNIQQYFDSLKNSAASPVLAETGKILEQAYYATIEYGYSTGQQVVTIGGKAMVKTEGTKGTFVDVSSSGKI